MTDRTNHADELLDVILGPNSTMRKAIERGRVDGRQERRATDNNTRLMILNTFSGETLADGLNASEAATILETLVSLGWSVPLVITSGE